MKTKILVLLFALFLSTSAYSQLLVTNSFTGTFTWGTNGNTTNFSYNGLSITDVTVSGFTKVNVTSSSSSGNFRASAWSTNATADLTKYFEFSLTAAPGTTLNMSNITFGIGRSSTGPLKWEWRSSIDSFAAAATNYTTINTNLTLTNGAISVPDLSSSWSSNTVSFSDIITMDTVTFRFYGYGAKTNSGTGGFQGNLTFTGESIAVIPEPSTFSLLIAPAVALLGYRMRLRLRK